MGKLYKILMEGGNMNRRNLLKLTGLALTGKRGLRDPLRN